MDILKSLVCYCTVTELDVKSKKVDVFKKSLFQVWLDKLGNEQQETGGLCLSSVQVLQHNWWLVKASLKLWLTQWRNFLVRFDGCSSKMYLCDAVSLADLVSSIISTLLSPWRCSSLCTVTNVGLLIMEVACCPAGSHFPKGNFSYCDLVTTSKTVSLILVWWAIVLQTANSLLCVKHLYSLQNLWFPVTYLLCSKSSHLCWQFCCLLL